MKYVEVKFQALPKRVRNELNTSYCGGWLKFDHKIEEGDAHFVIPANEIITEYNVMIFCQSCLVDFWSNKPV